MRPLSIPKRIADIVNPSYSLNERIKIIKEQYRKLRKDGTPVVSIVIPAYNEEKNILQTLQSLVQNETNKAVEIIVVNNNSTDKTEDLVRASGVDCILETKKGITAARNAGLNAATGKYILNADADAIYPHFWVEEMVNPLDKTNKVAITYGRFSFIPIGTTSRFIYFFYEYIADLKRYINKFFKEEAVNVYGFNSGYRRTQGLQVDGYNHPIGANEDGYLALKLRNQGFGKIHYVTNIKALVWTTDRRIQMEGGFTKGVSLRIKKLLYPGRINQVRSDL